MPDIALAAEARAESGSSSSRRTRTDGRIPAVIYGHGIEPVAVTIDARELRGALNSQAGGSVLFNVNVGKDQHLVIAREVERHPIRNTVAHVDFQVVRRDEVISATVQINLVGETTKVTRAGGIVEHALCTCRFTASPRIFPLRSRSTWNSSKSAWRSASLTSTSPPASPRMSTRRLRLLSRLLRMASTPPLVAAKPQSRARRRASPLRVRRRSPPTSRATRAEHGPFSTKRPTERCGIRRRTRHSRARESWQ